MLRKGNLKELLEPKNGVVLNALDIPMGGAPLESPPQYLYVLTLFVVLNLFAQAFENIRHLASNEHAWQMTKELTEISTKAFPHDTMMWGTAATKQATTWPHVDDCGTATVVKIVAGHKYWVIMRPKLHNSSSGDMGTIKTFSKSIQPTEPCDKIWDCEGVLLGPGDMM
jgi:hypothetical protein